MKKNNKLLWMNFLNITACICVVLLHCNHHVKYLYDGTIDFPYFWGLIVYSFAYWPVAAFMMLSGCNLINTNMEYYFYIHNKFGYNLFNGIINIIVP